MNRCLVTYDSYGTKLEFDKEVLPCVWGRLVNAFFVHYPPWYTKSNGYWQIGHSVTPQEVVTLVNMPVIIAGE